MAQGVVKVYDPKTGFGVIVSDADINFEVATEGDKTYASSVRIGSDGY